MRLGLGKPVRWGPTESRGGVYHEGIRRIHQRQAAQYRWHRSGRGPVGDRQLGGGGPRRTAAGNFHFHAGGLDSRSGEHLDWETPGLAVGDAVTVEIVEAEQVGPESKRYVPNLSGGG
jgi:hypothetical protein